MSQIVGKTRFDSKPTRCARIWIDVLQCYRISYRKNCNWADICTQKSVLKVCDFVFSIELRELARDTNKTPHLGRGERGGITFFAKRHIQMTLPSKIRLISDLTLPSGIFSKRSKQSGHRQIDPSIRQTLAVDNSTSHRSHVWRTGFAISVRRS